MDTTRRYTALSHSVKTARTPRLLWKKIDETYKQTGFPFPPYQGDPSKSKEAMESLLAWDTLPHQYVQSKLLEIDIWKTRLDEAIDRLALEDVATGLHRLSEITKQVFEEVEEFLGSPLARMKREEWERQSTWQDRLYSPSGKWEMGGIPMFENRISKTRRTMEVTEQRNISKTWILNEAHF